MKRTLAAFTISPIVASGFYWWFSVIEYFLRVGVTQSNLLGLYLAIQIFAFIGTGLFVLPAFLLMKKFKIFRPLPILAVGTLIGGVFISMMDTGVLWRHPEAFAVGFIAAATFNAIWQGEENA